MSERTCSKCGTGLYEDEEDLCEPCWDDRRQEWRLNGRCENCGTKIPPPEQRKWIYAQCAACHKADMDAFEHDLIFHHGFPTAGGSVWDEEAQEFY